MRPALAAAFLAYAATPLVAQSLTLKPNPTQHVTVEGQVSGPLTPGATARLIVEVTPKPGKRVYATGATDFQPVALVVTPHAAITAGTPVYPPAELDANSGSPTPVPVYRRTFRIVQPIRVARTAKAGQTLTLGAAVNYQACDDRLCYPSTSIPVVWSVTVQ